MKPRPIFVLAAIWLLAAPFAVAQENTAAAPELPSMPEGYRLQAMDDCGALGRQPHVVAADRRYTFPPNLVEGDERARTVTYGAPSFDVVYDKLDAALPWVVAVTYATEKGSRRVQSLTAGDATLHGPRPLPDGKGERLVFRVPPEAVREGRLTLRFTSHEGPNAVVSAVELWAPRPSPDALYLHVRPAITGFLRGRVSDLAFAGVAGAEVTVRDAVSGEARATLATGPDGAFAADASGWVRADAEGALVVTARAGGREAMEKIPFASLSFAPPRIRPVPDIVEGLDSPVISLDGTWRLNPSPSAGFESNPADGAGWADFTVPGQWLQQGFDIPRDREAGLVQEFEIPAAWAGKRLFLRFDAVHGGARYWLNGTFLGTSENLYTPVEFDATDAVRPGGTNRLAMTVRVQTPSETASFSSDYAFHSLGGIDRSVRLIARPAVHLASFHGDAAFDDAKREGVLRLDVLVANAGPDSAAGFSLLVSLRAPDGSAVLLPPGPELGDLPAGETRVERRYVIPDPRPWSAEKPDQYTLNVSLHRKAGDPGVERFERKIGFRTVRVQGSRLLVNGRPVKLAGVCRHEIDPVSGRAATEKHAEEDARLLRDANFNYIRTSHYPPTEAFLDACDRLGVYLQVEAPFCWARGGRGEDDPAQARAFLVPTALMLEACRDHPCVVLWSIGNESGGVWGGENRLPDNFAETLRLCRREDPSRPVLFSNEWARDGGAGDVAAVHYAPIPPEDAPFLKGDPRPILLDEYFPPQTFTFAEELAINPGLDIVNWSTGQNGDDSWWSRLYHSERAIGGAIWAGIDEEFYFPDGSAKGYGPWGFLDVWRRPKSLWWDAKRIHSPAWVPVRRLPLAAGQRTVRVPFENRYSFTDLNELSVTWELGAAKGTCRAACPPGAKGEIAVPLPESVAPGSLLVLRFADASGRLITAVGVTLGDAPAPVPPGPTAGCPEWRDDGKTIAVAGTGFALAIDRATGAAAAVPSHPPTRLLALPALFTARREDRNVFNPGGLPYAVFPDPATRVIESVTAEAKDRALAVTVRDRYRDFAGSVALLVDREGRMHAAFDYAYTGGAFTASEVGLQFRMSPDCDEIRWRRRTEWDVYPEDHIGRPEGRASARPGQEWKDATAPPYRTKPSWPWHLDPSPLGTRDFRAAKYNVYAAELLAPDGSGIRVDSDGSATVRACRAPGAVLFHVLLASPPSKIESGAKLSGVFSVKIVPGR